MTKVRIAWAIAAVVAIGATWYFTRPGWAPPLPSPTGDRCGGCQAGYECIPECGPPVAREGDQPSGRYVCHPKGQPKICPICLAEGTTIGTPTGPVPVQNLQKGDPVWSVDASGNRVVVPVLLVGHTIAPPTHRVIHLTLSDGRSTRISPGHPVIDGAPVQSAELIPYGGQYTYDLLPDSATGWYWADDILVGTTLR